MNVTIFGPNPADGITPQFYKTLRIRPVIKSQYQIVVPIINLALQLDAEVTLYIYFDVRVLRVRPGTSSGVAEFSEHEADGGELEEGERGSVEVLPVLGQSPAAVKPGDGALDDPALRERDEAFDPIRAFADFGFEMRQDAGQRGVKDRPLVGAVGEQLFEIGEQAEQRRQ